MTDDDRDEQHGGQLLGATAANGWRVIGRDECATIQVPGGTLQVHPKTALVFRDLAQRYHAEVEPLAWPGCWGYALRPIKGSAVFSTHAAGCAVDLCAPQHPQGVPIGRTYTRAKVKAIRDIVDSYGGVIEWGGEWDAPDTDGMHFQIADGVTVDQVERLAARLTTRPAPAKPAKPAPPARWTGPDLTGAGLRLRGDHGNNGPRVKRLQTALAEGYPLYAAHLTADGWWGPKTSAALAEFAHRSRIPSADGRNIGPRLAVALARAGIRP